MSKRACLWLAVIVLCSVASAAFAQTAELTQEQFIRIAVDKARELGYDTQEMDVVFDEGNKNITEHLKRIGVFTYNEETQQLEKDPPTTPEEEYPELKDRDYQAVYIGPKAGLLGSDLWVFIDKHSGEVIKYVCGQ